MLYVMTLGFRFDPIHSKVRVQRESRDENVPFISQVRKQNSKRDRDLLAVIEYTTDFMFITRCFISSKVLAFPNMII